MKVKKWLLGLITFAAMAVICAVCAGAETYEDFEYDVLGPGNFDGVDDYTIQITKYNGNDVSVDIPDSISGMSVASIAEHAFYNCTSLKTVTIPANVMSIGDEALGYYYDSTEGEVKKVDNFNINYVKNTWGHYYAVENGFSDETCLITKEDVDGFFYIRRYAGHCAAYEIPSEVDGKKITYISGSAFFGSTELTDITIPDSITYIGNYAFFNCTSLKAVTIPASVKNIGDQAFGYYDDNGIDKKLDDFKINYIKNTGGHQYAVKNGFSDESCLITEEQSDGTLEICGYAGNSTTYAIPSEIEGKKITVIGYDAFNGCTELTSVTIPDSITRIESRAFYDCASLKDVAIPASVTDIGWQAFYNCTSLKEVTIPASVTDIGWQAFYNCTSLKEVTIPASVTDIGNQAFGYCVDTVTYNSKKVDGFKINYVKNTQGHLYAAQNGFTDEACIVTNELEDGTLEITDYVGNSATYEIPAVIDGKKVTKIGNSAFSGCVELTNIVIPDSVKSIGSHAFYTCTSLKTVSIPASVVYIGDEAIGYYADNDSLTEKRMDDIIINYIMHTYGHLYAFQNGFTNEPCLITNELDDGTLEITKYAGNNTAYVIPSEINGKQVTTISYQAFLNCSKLTSVTIPESVTHIGQWAFYNCTLLKTISIPASVTDIGEEAFGYYCKGDSWDSEKIIDFEIRYIKNTYGHLYAFQNGFTTESCLIFDYLDSDTLKISKYVGYDKTYDIPTEIDYRKVVAIGDDAFSNCTLLTNITIPDSVTDIGWNAFENCVSLTSVKMPYSDTNIGMHAFFGCTSLKTVTIPSTVKTYIGYKAFGYCNDNNTCSEVKIGNFKIYCYSNTAGEQYAKDNGFTYELLDKPTLSKVTGAKLGGRAADALRVNWTKNASADGYIVEMYQGNKWARVAKITNNSTTTFRKAGLKAGTVYKFRVKAYKMSGKTAVYSAYSATVSARTNPSVIKGAKLSGRAADALRINWTKNASADGYIVEMYQNGKWTRVAKITSNSTTTFRKAGLKASTVYKFRVRAYKMSGKTALYGNYSATVTARTNPSIVKGVKIGGKAKDALRVNWTKNSSAQGYIVEMYKGGKWVRVAKITNSNTTTFRKAGLAKNTTYKFRVKAYYMSGKTALYGNYGSVSGKTAAK